MIQEAQTIKFLFVKKQRGITNQNPSHPAYVDICQREAEESSKARSPVTMRSFKESEKSQKTVKSMIETKGGDKGKEQGGKKTKNTKKDGMGCSSGCSEMFFF